MISIQVENDDGSMRPLNTNVTTAPVEIEKQSFSEYIAEDRVNWSTLKYMRESPLEYRYAVDVGRADNSGLIRLRATHTAVLEPEKFEAC